MSDRRFDPTKMSKLDNPERRKALPPEELLKMIQIGDQDSVLDLGAGTGYFAIPAAQMTRGTIYALDVEPQMLTFIEERVEEQGIRNINLVEGVIEEIPLADESVNHVLASFVLHEVEPLSKGLEEIHRVLKKGGSCFCLEWEKKPMEQGPPLNHRIHSEEMEKAFKKTGFTIAKQSFPTDSHYVIIATK